MLTRRFFIGGAGAFGGFGAFGGARLFAAAPGKFSGGRPRLRVGILSDIHVRFDGMTGKIVGYSDDATFVHALEWFRDQNVDAVMIAGDMADYGQICEMRRVAEDWFRVFPDDRRPDGGKVERIFVFGNHDWDYFKWPAGDQYGVYGRYGAKEESELPARIMHFNAPKLWEEMFHEPFARVFSKTVKGYRFIGAHWMDEPNDKPGARYEVLAPYLDAHRREIDPALPFFHVQHPHPQGTVFPWTRFHDCGAATRALAQFPNAVAISGHSHYSLTDERGIWQGAFTSVGAGCLRWTEPPRDANPPAGYANTRAKVNLEKHDSVKLMPLQWPDWTGRQGLLMDVHDDRIVFARRDFMHDLPLDDDWVVPLPAAESRPFAHAKRTAEEKAPQFRAGARLTAARVKAKTRGNDPNHRDAVEKDALELTVPQADAVEGVRPVVYEFATVSKDGRREFLPALDCGCTHSRANREKQKPLRYPFALEELPKGEFRFEVTPVGWFGAKGRPLVSDPVSVPS